MQFIAPIPMLELRPKMMYGMVQLKVDFSLLSYPPPLRQQSGQTATFGNVFNSGKVN